MISDGMVVGFALGLSIVVMTGIHNMRPGWRRGLATGLVLGLLANIAARFG